MSAFKMLTGKPLGRHKRRWENDIRMDLKERGVNSNNWVNSVEDMESPC